MKPLEKFIALPKHHIVFRLLTILGHMLNPNKICQQYSLSSQSPSEPSEASCCHCLLYPLQPSLSWTASSSSLLRDIIEKLLRPSLLPHTILYLCTLLINIFSNLSDRPITRHTQFMMTTNTHNQSVRSLFLAHEFLNVILHEN